jgi:hypothetical protein
MSRRHPYRPHHRTDREPGTEEAAVDRTKSSATRVTAAHHPVVDLAMTGRVAGRRVAGDRRFRTLDGRRIR